MASAQKEKNLIKVFLIWQNIKVKFYSRFDLYCETLCSQSLQAILNQHLIKKIPTAI